MPLPREPIYDSKDYWNLPEGRHAELIGWLRLFRPVRKAMAI